MEYRNPEVDFGGGSVPPDDVRVVTDAALIEQVVQLAARTTSA